jgi:hypothetical protein
VLQVLPNFKVGIGGQKYLDYRPMTRAEWTNPEVRARLLTEHRRNGGWQLLEDPLVVNDTLFVAEGYVQIGDEYVTAVGHDYPKESLLRNVYAVCFLGIRDSELTNKLPSLDASWTCTAMDFNGHPCLFVRSVGTYTFFFFPATNLLFLEVYFFIFLWYCISLLPG